MWGDYGVLRIRSYNSLHIDRPKYKNYRDNYTHKQTNIYTKSKRKQTVNKESEREKNQKIGTSD